MDVSQRILSNITVFNKYAKYVPELQRRENWDELCDRNSSMHIQKYPHLAKEIKELYTDFVKTKKVLPSMRSMQFGGRPIELANNRMFNCAYVAIDNPAAFWEAMFLLLGGSGVGFSVQKHHVDKLPLVVGPIKRTRRYLVGDSIEGWADAVRILVRAYFEGKSDPEFDFRDIRQKGSRLITSGGKAPGPDPLRICLDHIRAVLNNSVGRKLSSLESHDIMCHVADAVLSGGIRRAALISLFSIEDMDMLGCKSGAWWELNPQRGRANNSVVLERGKVTEDQFKGIWQRVEDSGSGEPGFFWTNDTDIGTNPCCVTGDTLVTVADENFNISQVRIDELIKAPPKYVVSFNVESGVVEFDNYVDGSLTRADADVIQIETEDGQKIKLTPDHRVFTENRGYIEAKDLTKEDILISI